MKTIGTFKLVDHGIKYPQYSQSRRVVPWEFTNVVMGVGNNPAEAVDDCLEQIAQAGFETEGMIERILEQEEWEAGLPMTPDVAELFERHNQSKEEYPYYFLSILWNPVKE